jgi:hypothetical protein
MLSRLMPHGPNAAAAAAAAAGGDAAAAESSDLSFDLGFSHGQNPSKPSTPAVSQPTDNSTVGVSEDLELSIMAPSPAAPAPAVDHNDAASRLSISSSLEPRHQRSPSDSHSRSSLQSTDVSNEIEAGFFLNITPKQAHFSLQSTATTATEASSASAAPPAPRKTKLQHIFEEIISTEGVCS